MLLLQHYASERQRALDDARSVQLAGALAIASFNKKEQLEQANKLLKSILSQALSQDGKRGRKQHGTESSTEIAQYIKGKKKFLSQTVTASKKFSSLTGILEALQDTIHNPGQDTTEKQE
jgi:hypothetical protein